MSTIDHACAYCDPTSEEPYPVFRSRVREHFAALGWTCVFSDEEADFFANGRWEVYASPGDFIGPPFDTVVLLEFPTEADRVRSDAGVDGAADSATFRRACSARTAHDRSASLGAAGAWPGGPPDHLPGQCVWI